MYLTEDEIVQDIKDNETVKLTPEAFEDPFILIELGRWIRNSYDLWHKENPHTDTGKDIRDGVDYTSNHPDQVAHSIIEKLKVL